VSYAPAVEGRLRTLSRAAAIAILLLALVVLRLGQPVWFTLALLAVAAFESNRYRVSSLTRLLSVVAQLGAIIGVVVVGGAVALYAESGRQAPVLRGLAILIFLGVALVPLAAFVGAVRTLRDSVGEP
jgi:hypothetical protein